MIKKKSDKLDAKFTMRYSKAQETELFAVSEKSHRKPADYLRLLIHFAYRNKIKL